MATEEQLTPTSYIAHHLTFNKSGEGFWAFHWDTIAVSVLVGVLALGFLRWVVSGATSGVPGKRQAFVEWVIDFVDDQVKGIYHGDSHRFVAATALTVFLWVLLMNAMDFLPVDLMAVVPPSRTGPGVLPQRADRRREHDLRAGAVGVAADDLLLDRGQRSRAAGSSNCSARRSARIRCCGFRTCCSTWSS